MMDAVTMFRVLGEYAGRPTLTAVDNVTPWFGVHVKVAGDDLVGM
jgi:hypothetical protein